MSDDFLHYSITEAGKAKVIRSFGFTKLGAACFRLGIFKSKLSKIESFNDSYAVCHFMAGVRLINPLSWPVALFIELLGFFEDLWCDGLRFSLGEVGRSRYVFSERVRLKIGEHIAIRTKEASHE